MTQVAAAEDPEKEDIVPELGNPFALMFRTHTAELAKKHAPSAKTANGKTKVPVKRGPPRAKAIEPPSAPSQDKGGSSSREILWPLFNKLVKDGEHRTGFERRRLERLIPDRLKPLFREATCGVRVPLYDSPDVRDMIACVGDIYKILPDYTAEATTDEAKPYSINGKEVNLLMSPKVAADQLSKLAQAVGTRFSPLDVDISVRRHIPTERIHDKQIYYLCEGNPKWKVGRHVVAEIIAAIDRLYGVRPY